MRETLTSWHRSGVGRKKRKVWRSTPLYLFGQSRRKRIVRHLKILCIMFIELNWIFLCNLWAWSNLFIDLDSSSIVDFVDWIGSC